MDIDVVFFDWGGVLIQDPTPGIIAFVKEKLRVSDDFPLPIDKLDAFQRGEVSESDFWSQIGVDQELAHHGGGSLWRDAFESTYSEKSFVFDWIEKIRAQGIKTAVLSNTEMPAVEMFKTKGYQCFDELVFSCCCGMTKPNLDIYEHAMSQLGVSPERAFFIDDKPENTKAASSLGMQTHTMTAVDSLKSKVISLGLDW